MKGITRCGDSYLYYKHFQFSTGVFSIAGDLYLYYTQINGSLRHNTSKTSENIDIIKGVDPGSRYELRGLIT